jgi:hypothetical protein
MLGVAVAADEYKPDPSYKPTLKITVKPKWEKATGNFVRIGGFCVANPKPVAK